MKKMLAVEFFFIASLLSFSSFASSTDEPVCPSDTVEPFSVSIDIPEMRATDGTIINDPINLSFTRARCTLNGQMNYQFLVTVSPQTAGHSKFNAYKYKFSQRRIHIIRSTTIPQDLEQPITYSLYQRIYGVHDLNAPITLTIFRDCSLLPTESNECVDDPEWRVFEFPAFGETVPTNNEPFNVTGFWYDPTLTGSGFNFAQIRGETHLYYYGYTADGQRLWLISDGGKVLRRGEKQTYQMLEIKNGTFETPSTDLQRWGTLDLVLEECGEGAAVLAGVDGVEKHNLKLLGSVDGTQCTGGVNSDNNGTFNITGFWYDPALTGSGFNFAQIRGETYLYYYGYTADGQRLWLISDEGKILRQDQTQTFNMLEIKDGTFGQPSTDSQSWGSLELTPGNCGEGRAVLNGADGNKSFDLKLLGKVDDTVCQ